MEHNGIALLIDADNCPASKITDILDELSKYGVINIRRAYGDWKSQNLNGWAEILHDHAIQPIQQFAYTKGKNATDSAIIIDAMDLLHGQKLSAFGIASSDSDFTPLAMRLRAAGHKVFGFGEKKTPPPFVNACTKFLFLESLGQPTTTETQVTAPVPTQRKSTNELRCDTRLVNALRNAVTAISDEEGWAALASVGHHINKSWPAFDQRNYGYSKLGDLVIASELFELRRDNHNHMQLRSTGKKSQKPKPTEKSTQ
ncbi:NYN domain-containing protein [Dechloromonas sp. CZR5]|uniref:NYN domain-containing protein n=1 Tax=Dechloromonas sp. CZR5 TaxID=2608630 RepID=UPI00123D9EC8|nr:NYN domain-containing protein [Dechloromonas sp. CZR5]